MHGHARKAKRECGLVDADIIGAVGHQCCDARPNRNIFGADAPAVDVFANFASGQISAPAGHRAVLSLGDSARRQRDTGAKQFRQRALFMLIFLLEMLCPQSGLLGSRRSTNSTGGSRGDEVLRAMPLIVLTRHGHVEGIKPERFVAAASGFDGTGTSGGRPVCQKRKDCVLSVTKSIYTSPGSHRSNAGLLLPLGPWKQELLRCIFWYAERSCRS